MARSPFRQPMRLVLVATLWTANAAVAASLLVLEWAQHAYVRLKVIEDAVDAVKSKIRRIASQESGVPLPNGKVLRVVQTTSERFSKGRLPKDRTEEIMQELRDVGALAESTYAALREVAK